MATIWPSEKAPPNAGMAPGLPLRMRAMMKSSLRLVPASFGPLPSVRPPSWWQKPHTPANRVGPSMSLGDASGGGGAVALAGGLGLCCAQTQPAESASANVASTAPVRRSDIHITSAGGPHPTLTRLLGRVGCGAARPSYCLSANTNRAPVFFAKLLKGSPHSAANSSDTKLPQPAGTAMYCLPPAM